jgi:hypothetical protein
VREITELYWTVKSFKINISVVDMNFDPFTQFLLGGGSSGSIVGSLAGIAAANQSLSQSPIASVNGRTKVFSSYLRKNRVCKETDSDDGFKYDNYGNIINTNNSCKKLKVKERFVSSDKDIDESRLCVAGPIHSFPSSNGQGYVQINFTDVVYANRLYWPIIVILLGNGEAVLTSDIMSLGVNQNNYNIGGISFANYGVITLSGYSSKTLQPIFYSVGGNISIGERCCDKFYYDGFDRGLPDDECYQKCQTDNEYDKIPPGQEAPSFVGGGGDSGGGGGGGSFDW